MEGDENLDEECEEGDLITNDDPDEEDLEGDEGEGDEGENEEQMDYYMR